MTNLPSESFFRSYDSRSLRLVVVAAVVFHAVVALAIYAVSQIKVVKEPELIPIFELVQVAEPAPEPAPPPPAPELPEPLPPKSEAAPKPVSKPVPPKPLPPEPKIEERVEPEPEPVEEVAEEAVEPVDDFNIDDMALPAPSEKSSLKPVGSVAMDPLLQAFLERLKQLVMQNFNPPNGIQIARSAKTTVQFTVDSAGNIADVILKTSSGNKTWDALSVRAVQITKSPALPATYSGELLSLQFNFTPN